MRAETPPRPWLFSPAVDLLVGCGAWSLPLLGLTFWLQRTHGAGLALGFYLLALFCNQPHYMATLHRAYRTAGDFRKYRFFTVYVTALCLLTAVVAHIAPGLFPWLITFYLTWSPWHYTGQNFGIAQMMVRRAGAPPDPTARHLLYTSYVASFAVWVLMLHSTQVGDDNFLSLRLPERFTAPLQVLGGLVFAATAGAAFLRLRRHLPWRALAPALTLTLTQLLWFVVPALLVHLGALTLPSSYFSAGALAFMHCAQYLWITAYFARQEEGRPDASPTPGAGFSFGRYYLGLIVGGIALFIPGPWLASRVLGHDFVESFLVFTALVNLHHFSLDGAIWKLRDGRIARLLLGRNPPGDDGHSEIQNPDSTFQNHLGWLFGPAPAARILRRALGAALLALAALDQWQYYSTTRSANAATLAAAEAVNPHDPRPAFRRAQLAVAANDLATARHELERLVELNPRNVPALHLLGEVLLRAGDLPAALTLYDRMFALFPADFATALNRGIAAARAGDPARAVTSLERAVQLAPDDLFARLALANQLSAQGAVRPAIDAFEEFLTRSEAESQPPDLSAYLNACADQAGLLLASAPADRLRLAEPRLQRAADLAATRHLFAEAEALLNRLAEVQDRLGRPADAARNRALAAQAKAFGRSP